MVIEKELSNIKIKESVVANIEFKWLDINDLDKIISLKHLTAILVTKHLSNNARCLGVFIENNLIGYIWYHPDKYKLPFFNYNFNCKEKPHIGPSFIKEEFRGKRLHEVLLVKIFIELLAKDYKHAQASVWTDNISSLKGVLKSGFYPVKSILAIRILNQLVYKRVKNIYKWPLKIEKIS